MAAQLPPEQHASYSAIIDDILATSDLNTISAKRIRKGLQERVRYDLTPQKTEITELIMDRFDRAQSKIEGDAAVQDAAEEAAIVPEPQREAPARPPPTTNGGMNGQVRQDATPSPIHKRKASEEEDDDLSDVVDKPLPKKVKKGKREETDAELAARLQAELNQLRRATRNAGTKRKAVVKKSPKKKSAARVNAEDDSALSGEDGEKPEKEKKGGFHKPMNLSEPLAAMLGETQLSRPQTVKKIWAYVKERDLQDPEDKRQIRCDDAMRAVFKSDRIHMFTMNKVLATQLYPVDDV